jgi:hypothetical protein
VQGHSTHAKAELDMNYLTRQTVLPHITRSVRRLSNSTAKVLRINSLPLAPRGSVGSGAHFLLPPLILLLNVSMVSIGATGAKDLLRQHHTAPLSGFSFASGIRA